MYIQLIRFLQPTHLPSSLKPQARNKNLWLSLWIPWTKARARGEAAVPRRDIRGQHPSREKKQPFSRPKKNSSHPHFPQQEVWGLYLWKWRKSHSSKIPWLPVSRWSLKYFSEQILTMFLSAIFFFFVNVKKILFTCFVNRHLPKPVGFAELENRPTSGLFLRLFALFSGLPPNSTLKYALFYSFIVYPPLNC